MLRRGCDRRPFGQFTTPIQVHPIRRPRDFPERDVRCTALASIRLRIT
jgi:hypothetical protein